MTINIEDVYCMHKDYFIIKIENFYNIIIWYA